MERFHSLGNGDALRPRFIVGVIVGILAASATLRCLASVHDLWLDEIWTLFMIDCYVTKPLDLVTGSMRHDNNHLLNTLYLSTLGPHLQPLVYRLPAVAAGTVSAVFAWLIGRQRSALAGWWSCVAFAISHVLVCCSSEARGYGLMSLFLLIAQWVVLEAFDSSPSVRAGGNRQVVGPMMFNIACVLGILSHLTFVNCYLAMCAWSTWLINARKQTMWRRVRSMLIWHAVPLTVIAVEYLYFVRGMTEGRGRKEGLFTTICNGLSALTGGPIGTTGAIAIGLGVAVIGMFCLAQCWRDRPARGIFFLLSILVMPGFVLMLFPIEHYAVRYLLGPLQTLLLLIATESAFCIESQRSLGRRVVPRLIWCVALVAAAANLCRDATLILRGRGAYREILQAVVAASDWPGPTIDAASDSHFRHKLLIAYHQRNLGGRGIRLVDDGELPPRGAEWFFVLDVRDGLPARQQVFDRHGNAYALVAETRGGSLSGTHWQLYRNQTPPDAPIGDGSGSAAPGPLSSSRRLSGG